MWTKSTFGQYGKCSARYECCNGTKLEDLEQWLDDVWKLPSYKKARNQQEQKIFTKSENSDKWLSL